MESPPPPPQPSLGALIALLRCALFPASGDCRLSVQSRRILLRDLAAREFNAFLWFSLVAVTALLLAKLFRLLQLWRNSDLIAGPPCASFYGHHELLSRNSLTEVLSDSHKKYGSVVKLWLGPTQLLVSIKDPKLVKDLLYKAVDKLPSTGKAFNLAFGRSTLFASTFSEVRKKRETLMNELNARLLESRNVIPSEVVDCIVAGAVSVDCKVVSQQLACSILGTTLFGDSFLTWSKANVYGELLMVIAKDASFWASYNITPFWNRGFWKYRHLCEELKCLTREILQQRQSSKDCELFNCGDPDLSDRTKNVEKHVVPCWEKVFLPEMKDHLSEIEEEPLGNIMGMMFHGCLTTTGLINNILMRLVQHPKLQDEIYAEITMAHRDLTTPVEQGVDQMPLLFATVYESSRLFLAGPLLLQRCSLEHDLYLENGVAIPAGAAVVVPIRLMYKNYSSWGTDACEFNPYRFLSQTTKRADSPSEEASDEGEKSFVLKDPNDNDAYLTFGSGFRACVGQKLVIRGVTGLFASLLKHYEIKLQPEAYKNQNGKVNNWEFLPSMEIAFMRRNN